MAGVLIGSVVDLLIASGRLRFLRVLTLLGLCAPSQALEIYLNVWRLCIALLFFFFFALLFSGLALKSHVVDFVDYCEQKARWTLSHPQIITRDKQGQIIDDYRESYVWFLGVPF